MPYYLKHYFDPTFDHLHLKPRVREDGTVDHQNMGYVQNVIQGQVLAEFVPVSEEAARALPPGSVFREPRFPMGRNCEVLPQNPFQLLASANGYVFYDGGLIHVKRVLNVRQDVGVRTGNVHFVGDVIVHGTVRSGFELVGRDIRVQEMVEAAHVEAGGNLQVDGGVRGAGQGMVRAGKNIRVGFCENATLWAGDSILVDKVCMHSQIFCQRKMAVRDRLVGGRVCCQGVVFVGAQLGGGLGTPTELVVGFDAYLMGEVERLERELARLGPTMKELQREVAKGGVFVSEYAPRLARMERKMRALQNKVVDLRERLHERFFPHAAVVVPGEVRPGVTVTIGTATLQVRDFLRNVRFELDGVEIAVRTPALVKTTPTRSEV